MGANRVRYARNGNVHLAYRVFGDTGPMLLWVPGWVVNNVETYDDPSSPYALLMESMSRNTHVVVMDRRGTGLSDPVTQPPSLDERVDDVRAVLEDVGAEELTLVGSGEGGPICILFAATYPEHIRSLVLWGTAARFSQQLPEYPWGFTEDDIAAQLAEIDDHWGEGALAELYYGETASSPGVRELFGRHQRAIASPMLAHFQWQALMEIDVRGVLGAIRVPTLALARPDDRMVPIEAAAALAAAIPNAMFKSFPAGAHNGFDVIDGIVSAALEFLGQLPDAAVDERVLKTVLFTDIVGSTERLDASGDAHWRHQLDTHDRLVTGVLARHGGVRAKHTGDGIFAVFDGPTRAVRCALELVPALVTRGMPIRAGVHTGECERRGDEWSGMAVHIGARIGGMAGAGEVLTSRTVRDLSAGSGIGFESLGPQALKGIAEAIEVFRVVTPADVRS